MSNNHRIRSWALACGMLAAGGVAQAREVFWSVGVGSPGVQVDLTNARPVYVPPQPVYWLRPAVIVQPQPVYYAAPQPVYYTPPQPVYYAQPQPVYYGQPQVIFAQRPHDRGWGPHRRGHWGHHREFDYDRRHGHDRD